VPVPVGSEEEQLDVECRLDMNRFFGAVALDGKALAADLLVVEINREIESPCFRRER
jgi:hypothetical protein